MLTANALPYALPGSVGVGELDVKAAVTEWTGTPPDPDAGLSTVRRLVRQRPRVRRSVVVERGQDERLLELGLLVERLLVVRVLELGLLVERLLDVGLVDVGLVDVGLVDIGVLDVGLLELRGLAERSRCQSPGRRGLDSGRGRHDAADRRHGARGHHFADNHLPGRQLHSGRLADEHDPG